MEKNIQKKYTNVYLTHFAVQQKLTQHCTSIIQFKKTLCCEALHFSTGQKVKITFIQLVTKTVLEFFVPTHKE